MTVRVVNPLGIHLKIPLHNIGFNFGFPHIFNTKNQVPSASMSDMQGEHGCRQRAEGAGAQSQSAVNLHGESGWVVGCLTASGSRSRRLLAAFALSSATLADAFCPLASAPRHSGPSSSGVGGYLQSDCWALAKTHSGHSFNAAPHSLNPAIGKPRNSRGGTTMLRMQEPASPPSSQNDDKFGGGPGVGSSRPAASSRGRTLELTKQWFDSSTLMGELTTDDGIPVSELALSGRRSNWVMELLTLFNSKVLSRIVNRMAFTIAWSIAVTTTIAISARYPDVGLDFFTDFEIPGWPHELVGTSVHSFDVHNRKRVSRMSRP